MLIVIAASGLVVWMLLALVTGLVLGAMTRMRDRCGVPGVSREPMFEAARDAAGTSR